MEAIETPASRTAFTEPVDVSEARTWMAEAVCKAADPSLFFDGSPDDALAVCAVCPVRVECLDYAIREGITDGVFGGMTEAQRKRIGSVAA